MNNKIMIKAYTRMNLGDDLFIKCLCQRYPDHSFVIDVLPKYRDAFVQIDNLKFASRYHLFFRRIVKRFPKLESYCNKQKEVRAKAIIHIGGSIFIEYDGWEEDLRSDFNDNVFYLGANFGPYKSTLFLEKVRNILAQSCDVCFRDTKSYNLFSDLKNVRVAPDILFGYKLNFDRDSGKGIAISMIDLRRHKNLSQFANEYEKTIASICDYASLKEIPVKLCGFCKAEGDEIAIDRVLNSINDNKNGLIEKLIYNGDIETFINSMNKCEYIIGTRFHSLILGWKLGKKVLPVIYSLKQINLLTDLEYEGPFWDIEHSPHESYASIIQKMNDCSLINDISGLDFQSKEQFRALDVFLY